MNHIGDMSTTTTPAAACECWAPLCVWDSGERKRKGNKDHRGQGEKLPPCFSRQQMPPPPSPVQHLLALPFARRSKGRYKEGDGREPRRPFAHPTASQLGRPTTSPSSTSSLLGENQGKTHQPHGRTRPWGARPTTASLDSSRAVRAPPPPHRRGAPTPLVTPRAPRAAEPLTHTRGPAPTHKPRSSPTALPAVTGRPFPAPGLPCPFPQERPARPAWGGPDPARPAGPSAPPAAAGRSLRTRRRQLQPPGATGWGREARLYHSGRGSLVWEAPFSAWGQRWASPPRRGWGLLSEIHVKHKYQRWHSQYT